MLRSMQPFNYLRPSTLSEALKLLGDHGREAKVLAGGTDLIVGMKEKGLSPRYVIDIKGIEGLDGIGYDPNEGLRIGTLATMSEVSASSCVREHYLFLAHAAGEVGSVQVRNRATIGGNLCNAAPSAETAPALLCLDAVLTVAGPKGERAVAIEEFFRGPGMTVLDGEILTGMLIPPVERKGIYIKHSPRNAMDIAVIGAAAAVTPKEGGWENVRIALGAVAPTPVRVHEAEELIRKKGQTKEAIEEAGRMAGETASPIFDVRASAEYRSEMVENLVIRALSELCDS
ncbi:MAG: xanthine dehydrogenase family protein subunit M [Spirochaetes bacterium]|nr:xanthine dehydrogenase family protein subunit M [Spirochaetota bacterium]